MPGDLCRLIYKARVASGFQMLIGAIQESTWFNAQALDNAAR
jgi:hypothetical protein